LKTACKKLFAVAIAYGKTSWLAGVWHRRLALNVELNGGHDALVLLAGAERTAASCSAVQRGSFYILSELQLHRVDAS